MTIAGRGSRIIGGSIQSELTRDEVVGGRPRRLLPPRRPRARSRRGARGSASRSSACRSSPTRRSPGTSARSCGGTGPRRSGQGGGTPRRPPRPARRDPLQRRRADARDRPRPASSRSSRRWFADDPGAAVRAARARQRLARPGRGLWARPITGSSAAGGGIRIGGGTARSFYVGFQAENGRPPLALRRPPRRPGGGRDRDRPPRLRPADGPAGRLPAGEQLGPARRPARATSSPPTPTRSASCPRCRA